MQQIPDTLYSEAAVLTRVVESLMRKLLSFLVGQITLVKLQQIIKYIFIEEAENKLRRENPTKNISLTKLALLTGLDTRTLTRIRNSGQYRRPLHKEANFLREFTPGAAIIDAWCSKPPYFDESTGLPKALEKSGSPESFKALFYETTKSRGVTYKSLLNRLVESGVVEVDAPTGKLTLVSKSYLPAASSDKFGAIEMGFSAIGSMLETVIHNIEALDTNTERFYQRGAWTYRLSPKNQRKMRRQLRKLLEETDTKARSIIGEQEEKFPSSDNLTVGVSLFYFEEASGQQHAN